jgi:hypothetical protein
MRRTDVVGQARIQLGHRPRRVPRAAAATAAVLLAVALAGDARLTGREPAGAASAASQTALAGSKRDDTRAGLTSAPLSSLVNAAVYDACRNEPEVGRIEKSSAYVAGYADASKEQGALPVGFPSLAAAVSANAQEGLGGGLPVTVNGDEYSCVDVNLQLDYDGFAELPPMTATFLGFGFMPVTATVLLTETGAAPVATIVYNDTTTFGPLGYQYTAVSAVAMSMQLTEVEVNGTPLNVGSDCVAGPLSTPDLDAELGLPGTVVLVGGSGPGYPLPEYGLADNGGALAGTVTIPPFTGCETPAGENLDPLLTASVSGAGNYLQIVQGPLCVNTRSGDFDCTGQDLPLYEPLWTVQGGSYSGTGQVQIVQTSESSTAAPTITTTITCPGSITGQVPDLSGPPRDVDLGTITWDQATCTGTSDPGTPSTWTLQQAPAYLDGKLYPDPSAGTVGGNVDDFTLVLTQIQGSEPGCTVTVAGDPDATFAFPSTVDIADLGVPVTSSTCSELPVTGGPGGTDSLDEPASVTGNYALSPSDISIVSP